MNCVSCGAIITADKKKCPYCGAINPEYDRRAKKLSALDREMDMAKEQTKRTFLTLWQDRLCNIFLIASIVLFFCIIGAMRVGKNLGNNLQSVKPVVTGKADMKVLDEYYNSKEYDRLYEYMTRNNLMGKEEYDKYSQAAAITHCMDKFREAAYMYVEYARGDRDNTKFGFTAEYVVDEAHFVYDYRFEEGEAAYLAHRDLDPENEKLYQDCKDEIRMIMTHYLLMTDEEFDDCFETENYYTLDYAEIIKERTGYFEY